MQRNERDENLKAMTNKIDSILDRTLPTREECYIFKIDGEQLFGNERLYEPSLISIGPYHHGKRNLQNMEEHKRRYLKQMIQRRSEATGKSSFELLHECLEALQELEGDARGYYAEAVSLDSNGFLEMMLLDGCFIIELFRIKAQLDLGNGTRIEPFLEAVCTDWVLRCDLMLLENQLPFFVLQKLYQLTDGGEIDPVLGLTVLSLLYLSPYFLLAGDQAHHNYGLALNSIIAVLTGYPPSAEIIQLDGEKLKDIKHLLDLSRKIMLIEVCLGVNEASTESRSLTDSLNMKMPSSATELRDSGIKIKGVKRSKFYDVRFANGVLEIPMMNVTGRTEKLLRNLIAYEGYAYRDYITYINDYAIFMDHLINTPKDVELLRTAGVIDNRLGEDINVCKLFSEMSKHTFTSGNFYYVKIFKDLDAHCGKRWNTWKFILKRDYFNTPWALLSVSAAIILLVLTLLQTVFSIL